MNDFSYNSIAAIVGYIGAGVALIALVISAILAWKTIKVYKSNSDAIKIQADALSVQITAAEEAKEEAERDEFNKMKDKLYSAIVKFKIYSETKTISYDGGKKMDLNDATKVISDSYLSDYHFIHKEKVNVANELIQDIYSNYLFIIETEESINTVDEPFGYKINFTKVDKNVEHWDPTSRFLTQLWFNFIIIRDMATLAKAEGDPVRAKIIDDHYGEAEKKAKSGPEKVFETKEAINGNFLVSSHRVNNIARDFADAIYYGSPESYGKYAGYLKSEDRITVVNDLISEKVTKATYDRTDAQTMKIIDEFDPKKKEEFYGAKKEIQQAEYIKIWNEQFKIVSKQRATIKKIDAKNIKEGTVKEVVTKKQKLK